MKKKGEPKFMSSEWQKKYFIKTLLSIIIILLFTYIIIRFNSDEMYCKHNPDKCVCIENKTIDWGCHKTWSSDKICIGSNEIDECETYRRKTVEELEIDYCNDNPTDEKRCVCEEIIEEDIYSKEKCTEVIQEIIYFDNITSYYCNNTTNLDFNLEYKNGNCVKENHTNYMFIRYCSSWAKFKSTYVKSRPKTECEKGNEDYILDCGYLYKRTDVELTLYYCEPQMLKYSLEKNWTFRKTNIKDSDCSCVDTIPVCRLKEVVQ